MKHAIAIAAVLGALSFSSCTSNAASDDMVEMEVASTATVLDVTGMT